MPGRCVARRNESHPPVRIVRSGPAWRSSAWKAILCHGEWPAHAPASPAGLRKAADQSVGHWSSPAPLRMQASMGVPWSRCMAVNCSNPASSYCAVTPDPATVDQLSTRAGSIRTDRDDQRVAGPRVPDRRYAWLNWACVSLDDPRQPVFGPKSTPIAA